MLFRKRSKVSPINSSESSPDLSPRRAPIKDSYLGHTYYFCLPGNAETYVADIGKISSEMNTERLLIKSNREEIEKAQMTSFMLAQDSYYSDFPSDVRANDLQLKLITAEVERLQTVKTALTENLVHYIPMSAFANTEIQALEAALKQYPAHAISLFKIVVPKDMLDFEYASIQGNNEPVEVIRFDLLKYLSSIKDLTFTNMHRNSLDNSDAVKPKRDLQALVDGATEYEKRKITTQTYGDTNKRTKLKTILETDPLAAHKDIVAPVRIDDKHSIGFIKHEKAQELEQQPAKPNPRSRPG